MPPIARNINHIRNDHNACASFIIYRASRSMSRYVSRVVISLQTSSEIWKINFAKMQNAPYILQEWSKTVQTAWDISQKSCSVLKKLGTEIQWVESYVTKDKVYCVYIAPNEELIKEHAKEGGFPANKISAITKTIDPTTSEWL